MSSYLKNKVKTYLFNIDGDEFENLTYELISFLNKESNIQKINANVEGSSDGDGGIDFFDHNSQVWYSVYGQKVTNSNPGVGIKSKLKRDLNKVLVNRKKINVKKWVFVCNRELGAEHHKIINSIYDKEKHGFKIGKCFDLDNLATRILNTSGGKEKLCSFKILDPYDHLFELGENTLKELKDDSRLGTQKKINNEERANDLNLKLSHPKIDDTDLKYAQEHRYEYLKNYIPLLLDGGKYSEKLDKIEGIYRKHINSDRGVCKDYPGLEELESFIYKSHKENEDGYNFLQDNNITKDFLLNNKFSQIGCFYQQLSKDFYQLSGADVLNLEITK